MQMWLKDTGKLTAAFEQDGNEIIEKTAVLTAAVFIMGI